MIQVAIVVAALAATVFAAVRVRDLILSMAIVVTASLVVLPVTWYHYPVALMPVAAALAISARASRPWVAIALLVADLAIVFLPLVWLAVAILIVASWMASRRPPAADFQ